MSTITFDGHRRVASANARPTVSHRAPRTEATGYTPRFMAALIRRRQAEAERIVAAHLSKFTDAQLLSFGHRPEDIAYFRRLGQ